MCTGLLASCICGHYQVLRWATRCPLQCRYPTRRLQRVTFQCSGCDSRDQEMLGIEIEASVLRRQIEGLFREAEAEMVGELDGAREAVRREWVRGGITAQERDGRVGAVEEVIAVWRARLEEARRGEERRVLVGIEKEIEECEERWRRMLDAAAVRPEDR